MRVAVILISGLAALIAAAPSPTISDAEIQAFHDLVSKSLAERESAPLLVAKDANCDDCKASYNLCVKLGTQAEGTTFHNAVCQAICQVHLCIFDWGRISLTPSRLLFCTTSEKRYEYWDMDQKARLVAK
ncbi:hypothetical protein EJ04DRAFT_526081 [Polyplosphaeria fusca]|uniref:Uncharacterized protein n=1 Tax=Polyplosphaeria fusca TaxID=682080 RepID=A0A9P4UYL5_9PLEO|nr:hypothetical protein EJ04DRAFT_526081 [Polyplosphaeria fusca]